jgi:hypothetical protein
LASTVVSSNLRFLYAWYFLSAFKSFFGIVQSLKDPRRKIHEIF